MKKLNLCFKNVVAVTTCLMAMTMLSSCDKKEPNLITLKSTEKTINQNEEYQIDASSNTTIVFQSENEFHAKVSETGLVTGMFVGETNITLSNGEDTKKVKITVAPKSNLYPEPKVRFGETKSALISRFGTPDTETSNGIGYTNYSDSAPILLFVFDNSNNLKSYAVHVKSANSTTLSSFLNERYFLIFEGGGIRAFVNALNINAATKLVRLSSYDTSYWQVTYNPY